MFTFADTLKAPNQFKMLQKTLTTKMKRKGYTAVLLSIQSAKERPEYKAHGFQNIETEEYALAWFKIDEDGGWKYTGDEIGLNEERFLARVKN